MLNHFQVKWKQDSNHIKKRYRNKQFLGGSDQAAKRKVPVSRLYHTRWSCSARAQSSNHRGPLQCDEHLHKTHSFLQFSILMKEHKIAQRGTFRFSHPVEERLKRIEEKRSEEKRRRNFYSNVGFKASSLAIHTVS